MAFVNNIQQDTVQQDTNRIPYQHTHAHTHTHTHTHTHARATTHSKFSKAGHMNQLNFYKTA